MSEGQKGTFYNNYGAGTTVYDTQRGKGYSSSTGGFQPSSRPGNHGHTSTQSFTSQHQHTSTQLVQGASGQHPTERNKYQQVLFDVYNHLKAIEAGRYAHENTAVIRQRLKSHYQAMEDKLGYTPGYTTEVESLRHRVKELEIEKQKQEKMLRDFLDSQTSQMSKSMSLKVSADESSLENVSIKNRPINVMEAYGRLCADQWLQAKQNLDDYVQKHPGKWDEKQKLEILALVLKYSEEVCQETLKDTHLTMRSILVDPVAHKGKEAKGSTSHNDLLSPDMEMKLKNMLGDVLRLGADQVETSPLVENITQKLVKKVPDIKQLRENPNMKSYMKACAQLAWKMVIQRPSMTFNFAQPSGSYDSGMFEPYWGSDDPKQRSIHIQFCVLPALMHGDKPLALGKVMLKRKQ